MLILAGKILLALIGVAFLVLVAMVLLCIFVAPFDPWEMEEFE